MFLEVKPGIWFTREWVNRILFIQVGEMDGPQEAYYVRITFEAQGGQSEGLHIKLYSGTPTWEAAHTKAAFLIRELQRFAQGEEVVLLKDSD